MTEKPLLNRKQVAERFGVCTETIKRWQHRGLLPAIVINPRVTRYRAEDVERFLTEGSILQEQPAS